MGAISEISVGLRSPASSLVSRFQRGRVHEDVLFSILKSVAGPDPSVVQESLDARRPVFAINAAISNDLSGFVSHHIEATCELTRSFGALSSGARRPGPPGGRVRYRWAAIPRRVLPSTCGRAAEDAGKQRNQLGSISPGAVGRRKRGLNQQARARIRWAWTRPPLGFLNREHGTTRSSEFSTIVAGQHPTREFSAVARPGQAREARRPSEFSHMYSAGPIDRYDLRVTFMHNRPRLPGGTLASAIYTSKPFGGYKFKHFSSLNLVFRFLIHSGVTNVPLRSISSRFFTFNSRFKPLSLTIVSAKKMVSNPCIFDISFIARSVILVPLRKSVCIFGSDASTLAQLSPTSVPVRSRVFSSACPSIWRRFNSRNRLFPAAFIIRKFGSGLQYSRKEPVTSVWSTLSHVSSLHSANFVRSRS